MESHAKLVHKTEVLRSDSHFSNDVSMSCDIFREDNSQHEVLREDDRDVSLEFQQLEKIEDLFKIMIMK